MSPDINVKSVEEIKSRRVAIDAEIQAARKTGTEVNDINKIDFELYTLAEASVIKSLIEAKMWYGKMLEGLGTPFPKELADRAE